MSKSILQIISSCSVQKTAPKNIKYSRNESILKIGHHACKGYSPCKILTLAQKLKFQKTCQNPFYKSFRVVLCKKTATKNTKYLRNESILNIGHVAKGMAHAKAIAFAKWLFGVKSSKCEKHAKTILQEHWSCSVRKTA